MIILTITDFQMGHNKLETMEVRGLQRSKIFYLIISHGFAFNLRWKRKRKSDLKNDLNRLRPDPRLETRAVKFLAKMEKNKFFKLDFNI